MIKINFDKNEIKILFLFVSLFIIIRSINFYYHFNFSSDQALFSLKAFRLWENKELTLIGPPISFTTDGRQIFQGSLTYYFMLIFLLPARFSPPLASYLFMLFSSLSIIPLYYSVKSLVNRSTAILLLTIYSLFPFYVNYTRFLWNPNFQFVLTPCLLFVVAVYMKRRSNLWLYNIGLIEGILLLFHYQFVLVIVASLLYILKSLKKIIFLTAGIITGFSPLILFDLRNELYNLKTIVFFLKNNSSSDLHDNWFVPHYFLSISLLAIVTILYVLKIKPANKINLSLFILLFVYALFTYLPRPDTAFGAHPGWNYSKEEIVYNIIKDENLSNYNVVNLVYDTKAFVQKYLLITDGVSNDFEDYYSNKYLFIVSGKKYPLDDPAYEVATFKPSKVNKTWKIDNIYSLYLLERR